jgi:hypothetical protein
MATRCRGLAVMADELLLHTEREGGSREEGAPQPLLRRPPWSPSRARPYPDLDGLKKRAAAEDSMQRTRFCVTGNEASVGTRSPSIGTLFTVHNPMSGIGLGKMVPPLESALGYASKW